MTAILEDAQAIEVTKWGGLNTAASSAKLPEGQSPNNQNVWMDEKPGSLVTANGYQLLGTTPSGNPATFLLNYYKTSDGSQTLLLSDGSTIWKTTDYATFTSIKTGLSSFFQLRGMVIRGKAWMTNGSDAVMTYDGTTLTSLDGTGGTPDVPVAKYINYHDERVWLYGISGEPSSLRFSDLTDAAGTEITPDNASAWPADNEIQVSEGDDDIGTGIFLYRGYLYAWKSFSIWRIVGYDEYTYTKVKTRSSTGTRFNESIRELDNLVHFIGIDGLYVFDGEDSLRVSDPIDPANPDEGVFSFRNLQQPLANTQFWNLSNTDDWDDGTVPRNTSTEDDRLTLASDDSQTEFAAGTLTRVTATDNSGYLQLSRVTSGTPGTLLSTIKSASLQGAGSRIGIASYVTDADTSSNYVGFLLSADASAVAWHVDLGAAYAVGRVIARSYHFERSNSPPVFTSFKIQASSDDSTWVDVATVTPPASLYGASAVNVFSGAAATVYYVTPTDITTDFTTASYRYWRLYQVENATPSGVSYLVIKELEIYQAGYQADGKYISATIDLGAAPGSFGTLAASIVSNSENYQFFTQSSADGSSWDAEANLNNGAAISSTLRRYLRWGVYLYSSTGIYTPVIDKVFVGSSFLSPIFDTGGGILQWGAFQLAANFSGQTISVYYRAATTSGGVSAASWTSLVNGAIPNTAITNQFIQLRLEMSTDDATQVPYITGTTVNWVTGDVAGINTLQNVASFVWLNRYWLSAATLGATENDIVIVRGKSTFQSPWHKKDFAILSFVRFQDYFVAGSSTDGSLYRMETGYSKAGEAMDSFYETADFDKSGFLLKLLEIIVATERSGPYDLSIGISTDGGISFTEKTIDLTRASLTQNISFTKKLIAGNVMADKFRIRIRINAADQPFSVDNLSIFYRLSPIRGSLN